MLGQIASRALDIVDRVIDALMAVALMLVTAIVFLNASGRYLFSFTVLGAEEAARLLMVNICFLGVYTLLRRDGHVQLVYKHAVSTVMPSAPIRLYDPSQEGQAAAAAGTTAGATTPQPAAQPTPE